jgi:predicted phosphodiesterase
MRYAILSDIHANWEALETAAQDLKARQIDRIAVLGDTVGYGANPMECFDWAQEHADIYLMGNHEKALFDRDLRLWFNPMAAEAIAWTEKVMKPEAIEEARVLPFTQIENHLMFAHGSPEQPETFPYILNYSDTEPAFKAMTEQVCFIGHTHVPCCFCEGTQSAEYLKAGIVKVDGKGRFLLNPGSVGQPRDQDPRLSYGIYDDKNKTFEIVRLEYNNREAARKIREAGLPQYLAARLL